MKSHVTVCHQNQNHRSHLTPNTGKSTNTSAQRTITMSYDMSHRIWAKWSWLASLQHNPAAEVEAAYSNELSESQRDLLMISVLRWGSGQPEYRLGQQRLQLASSISTLMSRQKRVNEVELIRQMDFLNLQSTLKAFQKSHLDYF